MFFEKAGYEADDILASIALQVVNSLQLIVHRKKNKKTMNNKQITVDEVIILSGDRDLLQMVDGKIKVQAPSFTKVSDGSCFRSPN